MSSFKPGEIEAIKAIRSATGLGLRESQGALRQYGSPEKAVEALSSRSAVEAYEITSDRDRRQAELYRALRDSGLYRPMPDGQGWSMNHHGTVNSVLTMDAAAASMIPQRVEKA